jgi:hypothetical protein
MCCLPSCSHDAVGTQSSPLMVRPRQPLLTRRVISAAVRDRCPWPILGPCRLGYSPSSRWSCSLLSSHPNAGPVAAFGAITDADIGPAAAVELRHTVSAISSTVIEVFNVHSKAGSDLLDGYLMI